MKASRNFNRIIDMATGRDLKGVSNHCAMVVKGGKSLSISFNTIDGHAETRAIRTAKRRCLKGGRYLRS